MALPQNDGINNHQVRELPIHLCIVFQNSSTLRQLIYSLHVCFFLTITKELVGDSLLTTMSQNITIGEEGWQFFFKTFFFAKLKCIVFYSFTSLHQFQAYIRWSVDGQKI